MTSHAGAERASAVFVPISFSTFLDTTEVFTLVSDLLIPDHSFFLPQKI